MEYIKRDLDAIIEYLNELSLDDLRDIHNEYCSHYDMDDYIYCNDEHFFSEMFQDDVDGAVRAALYGEYNYTDDYVKCDGYANLQSFDDPTEYIDISEIANDILENEGNYYDIELEDEE